MDNGPAKRLPDDANTDSTDRPDLRVFAPDQETPTPALHSSIEESARKPPSSHRCIDSIESMESIGEGSAAPSAGDEVPSIGDALAEALSSFERETDPHRLKEDLVDEIRRVVADERTHPSIFGRAADLVINGHLHPKDLRQILTDIRQIRRAHREGISKGFTTSPGAFFLNWCRKQPGWQEPRRKPR